jgi:hypothetical protein
VSPPLLLPDPSGEAAEAASRFRGFLPSPAGRTPLALSRSPSARRPKPLRIQASVNPAANRGFSGAGRSHQASLLPCRAGLGAEAETPSSSATSKSLASAKAEACASAALFRNPRRRGRSLHVGSRSAAPVRSRSFFRALPPCAGPGAIPRSFERLWATHTLRGAPPCPNGRLDVVPASACAVARPAPSLPSAAALPAAPPSRGMDLLALGDLLPSMISLRFLRVTRPATGVMLSAFPSRAKRNRAVDK